MAKEKLIKWPDFSALGMRLVVAQIPTGERRMIMVGGDRYPDRMKRMGFSNIGGFWMRKILQLDIAAIRREFPDTPGVPRVFVREMRRGEIVHVMRKVGAPTNEEVETKIALAKAIPLGLNHLGQEVLEGNEGRFIRQHEKDVVRESDTSPSLFLRATDDASLKLCAMGLMRSVMAGRIYRNEDLLRFAEIVYGKPVDAESPEMGKLHIALGHALAHSMWHEEAETEDKKFALALKLHEGLPPVTAEFAERIVTMPMGLVAQRLVGRENLEGVTLRVPSIGNGAFLSMVGSSSVQTGDAHDTLESIGSWSGTEFLPLESGKHDIALENLSYSILDPEVDVDGLKIRRADHLAIIQSLTARKPGGHSVFSFRSIGKHGEVDEDTARLISWVSARFEIDGMAQMDSHLFGRGSAVKNRYMLSVGKRGSRVFDTKRSLKVVYDYDALWDWSNTVTSDREQSAEIKKRAIEENALQAPYIPSSQISEPKGMIPRNLVGPTREALSRIEERVGNIDEWVASELGYELSELGNWLDAEQVDAVAMAIDAQVRGRGFIEADQTGMGKGRVLAAMARWALLNGQKVIFLTDKANLFSDFYRDLVDTNTDHLVKHRCMNQGVSIRLNGRRLHGPSKKEDIEKMVECKEVPHDVNVVFATYSQFNRDPYPEDSPQARHVQPASGLAGLGGGQPAAANAAQNSMLKKAIWIREATEGAFLILDESHVAAGATSNTGVNIAHAVAKTNNVVYSSATFAKGAKNFAVYAKVMPASIKGTNISDVLEAGGDPLLEVFSANLARDGVLIRREHDMSELQFIHEQDNARRERNEEYADKMANILEAMGLLSGEVTKFVNEQNRLLKSANKNNVTSGAGAKKKRKGRGFSTVNFGARLYGLQRQFMLALGVDLAAEKAIEALREGRKPVIVLEQTMETLLRDAVAKQEEMLAEAAEDEEDDVDAEEVENEGGDAFGDEPDIALYKGGSRLLEAPITFRDVLRKALDRMCVVRKVSAATTVAERLEIEGVKKFRAAIDLLIDAFPDLPASPIDVIRDRIERAGYSCGEISGRSMGLVDHEDGSQSLVQVSTSDKVGTIDRYNSGIVDAVVLTTAGSTGISLHSSRTFRDQRQRDLIELQIANDVNIRMQFFGRVNRKNQACPPVIRSLSSGLPSETRLLSMQNMKMRALSANTTSNQDNSTQTEDVPDLLNEVGSEVCRKYLLQNIDLAKRLAISLQKLSDEEAKKKNKPTFFADQLTGRLAMIPVQQQLQVYEDVTQAYNDELADMEARGINPMKTSEFDVQARVVNRTVLQGASGGDSVFNEEVFLTEIEFDQKIEEVSDVHVRDWVKQNLDELRKDARLDPTDRILMGGIMRILKQTMDKRLEDALTQEFKTVKDALAAPGNNLVKSVKMRYDALLTLLPNLAPGKAVTYNDAMGKQEGIITYIELPDIGREHLMGQYGMYIQRPGTGKVWMTLNGFHNMPGNFTNNEYKVMNDFRNVGSGTVKCRRTLMDGNMFMAANKALKEGFGTSIVYTDEQGVRQRGILLPKSLGARDLMNTGSGNNIPLPAPIATDILLNVGDNKTKFTNSMYNYGQQPLILMRQQPNEFYIAIALDGPTGTMLSGNRPFTSLIMSQVTTSSHLTGTIDAKNIATVTKIIYDSGFMLYAPAALEPVIEAKLQAHQSRSLALA